MVGIITRKDLLPESIDAQCFERGQYTIDGTLDTEAGSMLMNARSSATPSSPGVRPGDSGRVRGSAGGQPGAAQAASSENAVALTVEGVTGRRTQTRQL